MRLAPFFRSIDLLMIVLLVAVVAWTFKVKNDSQAALARVAELEKQLEAEKTEIDLLKSDWALLTSPARLQSLVERYGSQLGLEPANPAQFVNQEMLPPLRQNGMPKSGSRTAQAQSDHDDVKTGSIPPENQAGGDQP